MKVITFANEKGGVGKTTLAIHFAAGLAMGGKRVVLIDADAQANATYLMGAEKIGGLYDLMVRGAAWKNVLKLSSLDSEKYPNLFVLPGNMETSVIPSLARSALVLYERLAELNGIIDVVVIDTSPVPSMLHSAIYLATDAVIYPTQLEVLSMNGLQETVDNLQLMRAQREATFNKTIQVLGVVPTMYNSNLIEHQSNSLELGEMFGEAVWAKIGRRVAWTEATKTKQMVWDYAPNTPAANEALEFVAKGAQYA